MIVFTFQRSRAPVQIQDKRFSTFLPCRRLHHRCYLFSPLSRDHDFGCEHHEKRWPQRSEGDTGLPRRSITPPDQVAMPISALSRSSILRLATRPTPGAPRAAAFSRDLAARVLRCSLYMFTPMAHRRDFRASLGPVSTQEAWPRPRQWPSSLPHGWLCMRPAS